MIFANTKKGSDRPLILLSDIDMDCFCNRIDTNSNKIKRREFNDDLPDNNSKLLCQYDNYWKDNFCSVGILTTYVNRENCGDFNAFKVTVDKNFEMLKNLIDKNNTKYLIIPAKLPVSKKKEYHII